MCNWLALASTATQADDVRSIGTGRNSGHVWSHQPQQMPPCVVLIGSRAVPSLHILGWLWEPTKSPQTQASGTMMVTEVGPATIPAAMDRGSVDLLRPGVCGV